jgi:prepilin-type N-terminal cleavage/methylation domain-containing protein
MMRAAKRSDAGFTLVEMLVVLSLIGLMSGLMLPLMGQFRYLTAADHKLTQRAALEKTASHIASLLEQSESLPLEIKPDAPLFFLEASEDSARFLAVAKSGALTSGLFEIEIGIEKHDGVGRVTETISPRRMSDNGDGKVKFDLMESAEQLTFSYLQKAEAPGRAPVWRADWQIAGQLPVAVRVSIQTKDKAGNLTGASAIAYLAR